MIHLNIWNTSYDQKKGWKSNWQFDSWPLKVKNCPNFVACRWRVTYHWKAPNEGYNFSSNLILIRRAQSHETPELRESQFWEFQASHLGVPRQNVIWMWPPWRGAKYTIRGKVVASLKIGPWWVLWVWDYPWLVLAPKVFKLCTNKFVVWFV
jgi:hypothetical protein